MALLGTADAVQRRLSGTVASAGVTLQQFNVLRILRGAGPAGLPTLTIRRRMIEEAPGITRLVDRLERAGLVRRDRASPDRRRVLCRITPAGMELLRKLDAPVAKADDAAFAVLTQAEQRELIRLLGEVQAANRSPRD